MTINLLDLLKDQIGGAVLGQVGKHVGLDNNAAQAGLGAILPTILGGLMKQASTPSGAETLNNSLDNDFGGGLLDKLPDMLGSGGDSSMMSTLGQGVLTSLFGDKVGSIVGILAKVSGIGSDKSGSLLTMLAPLVMSVLGKQKQSMGLDASGLNSLLMSQKDSVAESMPAGMSGMLGLGDLGISDSPARATHQTHDSGGGGLMKLLLPLVVVGVLGYFGYKMMNKGNVNVPEVPAVGDLDLGIDAGVPAMPEVGDMTSQLTGVFDDYRETLSGITDEASATEAVPKLSEFNGSLDGLTSALNKLPEAARGPIAGKVTSLLEPLQAIVEKLYAIPGVKPILEPVISSMMEKAQSMIPSA